MNDDRRGSDKLDMLIAGHSHFNVIRGAIQKIENDGHKAPFSYRTVGLLEETYWPAMHSQGELVGEFARILEAGEFRNLVLSVAGNDYNALGLVNPPEKFDYVLPSQPELPLDVAARLLPCGVVASELRHLISYSLMFMQSVRQAVSQPIFLLAAPPPIPSADHIWQHGGTFLPEIEKHGVGSAALRYKLWRTQSEFFEMVARENDIVVLPPPPEALDPEGMLAEVAWGKDATHANLWYGERVLRQIAEAGL